ncbi:M15 family metallopeptidase [Gordonia rhizosphera]|uniref:D-alanyl-D-alanine dipeptidase n=1 Tax=Gordonia rhizosphera NBRC 16068 TaxID=1108045 RepID=K6UXS2_9ACTN|nr:M15 family metallopeptidase [Gordonia rhizosphera]GAB88193.1 putative D-alanyl-D-alanine dipeptidase [Gordonia rhizosphera NBRC 16068]
MLARHAVRSVAILLMVGALVVGVANDTRAEGMPRAIPPVSEAARAVGLIDVRSAVPDALIDLRYATSDNFVGEALYPADARCLVHESMRAGLATAARALRRSNEVLVFWDCYRPHSVQQKMFDKVSNPAWVAAPGPYSRSHEAGRSVDVTVAARLPECPKPRRIADRCLLDMGTDFDSFTPAATAYATAGVPVAAQRARARLRNAMAAGGLAVYSGEWWHFDGPGAGARRPVIDVAPR